jgi:uncharacterized protein (DUF1778 family)
MRQKGNDVRLKKYDQFGGMWKMARSSKKPKDAPATSSITVRLDRQSKAYLTRAAKLRRISVSDYVRVVTVPQARREVQAANEQPLALTPEEQLAFRNALNETPRLTEVQRQLGSVMRDEA